MASHAHPARGPLLLLAAALSLWPPWASGQLPPELIEQALDQSVAELDVEAPLDEALAVLGEQTGLVFTIDRSVADLMPYGAKTRIQVAIRRMSVRDALTRVFDGLGLRMELRGDKVAVLPAPVLDRLGRRLSAAEAELLGVLAAEPWSEAAPRLPLAFQVPPDSRPRETFEAAMAEQVRGNRRATAMRQLDAVTRRLGWVWRPDGDQIVIETRRDDVVRRLDRPLDVSYARAKLDDVLVDLGRRIGVTMLFEPGGLQKVDARDRSVDLVQRGVTVRQTLERLCGNTGLRYEITDGDVRILGPVAEGGVAASAPAAAELVRMTIEVRPGVFMEVVIPARELPPDLRQDFERKVKDLVGRTARAAP